MEGGRGSSVGGRRSVLISSTRAKCYAHHADFVRQYC